MLPIITTREEWLRHVGRGNSFAPFPVTEGEGAKRDEKIPSRHSGETGR